MIFRETAVQGAFVVDGERLEDDRGFFARVWCQREFAARGLTPLIVQCSISFSPQRGTLRGMHYQAKPFEEAKLVRCSRGATFDVALDLRPGSPTFMRWTAVELTAENRRMLYVPEGCAHGFQTLTNDAEVLYLMSEFHSPQHAKGVRWNDPVFAIAWPEDERTISERDRSYPDFSPARRG